jgi:hypothetical protein
VQRTRLVSIVSVGVLAVSVIVSDAVAIPHRSHQIAVRRAADRRAGYLERLRSPLATVYTALKPLQDALAEQASGAALGIDLPARDVLVHTTATGVLAASVKTVAGLQVPDDLAPQAKKVAAALGHLAADTRSFPSLATTDGETLADAFAVGSFSDLTTDTMMLNDTVEALYAGQSRTPPRLPPTAPPSHDSYLFGVDSGCLQGEISLDDRPADEKTLADLEKSLEVTLAAGRKADAAVRAVPLPANDPKARSLSARIAVNDRYLTSTAKLLTAVRARDQSALQAAIAESDAVTADLTALGKAFAAYGASVCGAFYRADTAPAGGGGGSTGSGGQAT